MDADVLVVDGPQTFARVAAETFARDAERAVVERGRFMVALAGGSTPRAVYRLLADPNAPFRLRVPWSGVHVFWGDERHVPPDHPESNFRMAHDALLAHVAVPAGQIHRVLAELPDAPQAAADYERTLRASLPGTGGSWPVFDLVLLGMGPDGHTASLFPGTSGVREQSRWVVALWVEKLESWRITLTPPVINHARAVLVLVGGADKAAILRDVLEGPVDVDLRPAQIVRPVAGRLHWIVDRDAAARLDPTRYRRVR